MLDGSVRLLRLEASISPWRGEELDEAGAEGNDEVGDMEPSALPTSSNVDADALDESMGS